MKVRRSASSPTTRSSQRLEAPRQELFNLRFQHATGALENTARSARSRSRSRGCSRFSTSAGTRGRRPRPWQTRHENTEIESTETPAPEAEAVEAARRGGHARGGDARGSGRDSLRAKARRHEGQGRSGQGQAARPGAKAAAQARAAARSGQEGAESRRSAAPTAASPKPEREQGRRKERRGVVVSTRADKTITVRIDTAKPHPKYLKIVRRSLKLHAHDERNEAKVGDVVRVVETRPLSQAQALAPGGDPGGVPSDPGRDPAPRRRQHRRARAPVHPHPRRLQAPLRPRRRHHRRHRQAGDAERLRARRARS